MNNKRKDEVIAILILVVIFVVGLFVGKCLAQINDVNERIIAEYKARPVVIRAVTEEDKEQTIRLEQEAKEELW